MLNKIIGLALMLLSGFVILRWPVKPSAYRPAFVFLSMAILVVDVILIVITLVKIAQQLLQ